MHIASRTFSQWTSRPHTPSSTCRMAMCLSLLRLPSGVFPLPWNAAAATFCQSCRSHPRRCITLCDRKDHLSTCFCILKQSASVNRRGFPRFFGVGDSDRDVVVLLSYIRFARSRDGFTVSLSPGHNSLPTSSCCRFVEADFDSIGGPYCRTMSAHIQKGREQIVKKR